jgi:phosphodiesterase/alkaline phosphatase D-like protein
MAHSKAVRRSLLFIFLICVVLGLFALRNTPSNAQAPLDLSLPLQRDSVRFAVIGDSGTGERAQYDVGAQMDRYHAVFPFEFVIMLGDNIYGNKGSAAFRTKFEDPYRSLLAAGVKFYAALGNHDDPNERFYKPFNMDGQRYYTFQKGDAQFYALDSNYMDPEQLNWLDQKLSGSRADWKVCFFHHPLYSHARFHGPDTDLRTRLEPIFEKNGVNVVFTGHEHVYERLKPQRGIYYFVLGNAGELRYHDLIPSPDTVKGFDTDRDFMLIEITRDALHFQTISRTGQTVDSGALGKQTKNTNSEPTGPLKKQAAFQ